MSSIRIFAIYLCLVLLPCSPVVSAAGQADQHNMSVLVVGASGRTGRLVVGQLMRLGIETRAMTRNVERARQKAGGRFNWVEGDVSAPASLVEPIAGVSYVVAAMASSFRDPTNSPESVDHQGVINLVDAARKAGVRKLVLISSMGVTRRETIESEYMQGLLASKLNGENYLRQSGLPYTIIRPGGLTDEPGRLKALSLTQGDTAPFASLARADLARVSVECLTNLDALNKTFELSGAESGDSDAWLRVLPLLRADKP